MKKNSILFLSTFFVILATHASQLPPFNATQSSKTTTQNQTAWRDVTAGTVAGSSSITPSLARPTIVGSVKTTPEALAVGSSQTKTTESSAAAAASNAPAEQQHPGIKLEYALLNKWGVPAAFRDKVYGTDQTFLEYCKNHDPKIPLITNTTDAQTVLNSVVSNFNKREESPEKITDVKLFMHYVKHLKIKLGQEARQSIRYYLDSHEAEQAKRMIATYTQLAEQLKERYVKDITSMKETKAARDLTYQGESPNDEDVRIYKSGQSLMRYAKDDLITYGLKK